MWKRRFVGGDSRARERLGNDGDVGRHHEQEHGKRVRVLCDADLVDPDDESVAMFDLGAIVIVKGGVPVRDRGVMAGCIRLVHVFRREPTGYSEPWHQCTDGEDSGYRTHQGGDYMPRCAPWAQADEEFRNSSDKTSRGVRSLHRS